MIESSLPNPVCGGGAQSPSPSSSAVSSRAAPSPEKSGPCSQPEKTVRRFFRGGMVIAGRVVVDLFKKGEPKGTPSIKCLPSDVIWWRPQSRLVRRSASWRARILYASKLAICDCVVRCHSQTYTTSSPSRSKPSTSMKCKHSEPATSTT